MALLGKGGGHNVLICCVATAAVFVTLTRGGPVYMQHIIHSCMDIQPSTVPPTTSSLSVSCQSFRLIMMFLFSIYSHLLCRAFTVV